MHTNFWSENLKKGDHSEAFGVDGKITLNISEGNSVDTCRLDACGS
jgi:hypothetical protein